MSLQRQTGVVIGVSYRGACDTWGPTRTGGLAPPGIVHREQQHVPRRRPWTGRTELREHRPDLQSGRHRSNRELLLHADRTPRSPNDERCSRVCTSFAGYAERRGANGGPPQLRQRVSHARHLLDGHTARATSLRSRRSATRRCRRLSTSVPATGPLVAPATGDRPLHGASRGPTATETRIADNVEVKYTLVHGTGNNDDICDFGPPAISETAERHEPIAPMALSVTVPVARAGPYAVRVRLRSGSRTRSCRRTANCGNDNFNRGCEWYFTGSDAPPHSAEQRHHLQRSRHSARSAETRFTAGSIRWLQLEGGPEPVYVARACRRMMPSEARKAAIQSGRTSCFVVELGLKGGLQRRRRRPGSLQRRRRLQPARLRGLHGDGATEHRLGTHERVPASVRARTASTTNPLCPSARTSSPLPNPGSPLERRLAAAPMRQDSPDEPGQRPRQGSQRPHSSIPTNRTRGPNPPNTCPPQVGTGYTQGRNYWKHDAPTTPTYGYRGGRLARGTRTSIPMDPRVRHDLPDHSGVVRGIGSELVPDHGRDRDLHHGLRHASAGDGHGDTVDDPCADPPPSDVDLSGGSSGGRVVWGHFINRTVLSASATSSGDPCNPAASFQPCVPVLVE